MDQSTPLAVQHVIIAPEQDGQKLLPLVDRHFQGRLPKNAILRLIRTGQIRLDGRRAKPFARVSSGQDLRLPPVRCTIKTFQPTDLTQLDILHRDEHMLVINKPAGLPVHGGSKSRDSIAQKLAGLFADAPFIPVPVHRLDRDTTGILLAAKSFSFLRTMQEKWGTDAVSKYYICWCRGILPYGENALMEDLLGPTGSRGREKISVGKGKPARMLVSTLRSNREGDSLLLIRLLTGRKHQIRVQLAHRGHPLVGDKKYGHSEAGGKMLLHACFLAWDGHAFFHLPDWEEKHKLGLQDDTTISSLVHQP